MVSVLHLLAVFVLSIIELWIGIPVGFAFGLPPLVIGLVASVGATIGAIFVYLLVRKFIAWAIKKLDMDIRGYFQRRRIFRIWQKYGVIGLGMSAPIAGYAYRVVSACEDPAWDPRLTSHPPATRCRPINMRILSSKCNFA
jgi:hypothetical protein